MQPYRILTCTYSKKKEKKIALSKWSQSRALGGSTKFNKDSRVTFLYAGKTLFISTICHCRQKKKLISSPKTIWSGMNKGAQVSAQLLQGYFKQICSRKCNFQEKQSNLSSAYVIVKFDFLTRSLKLDSTIPCLSSENSVPGYPLIQTRKHDSG